MVVIHSSGLFKSFLSVRGFVNIVMVGLFAGASLVALAEVNPQVPGGNTYKGVHEFKLDNGLQVLVKPDRRAPVVVSQIWYRIGSSYEITGGTGVSHVLEHMMFKGTDRFAAGELSNLVAKYGGSENAFTGRDYTGYYQSWEKSRLPLSFAIESNRMQHLKLDPQEFKKEVRVVMEERRQRTDDSPMGTAYERFYAAAFVSSPYQGPIIGWMHDLKRLTLEFTRQWYEKWYSPNNATLVVAGDVEPEEVLVLAEQYFGAIESKQLPELPFYREVEPKGQKRLEVKDKVEVPQLTLGFMTPSIATAQDKADIFALSMLMYILDGGLSARFETNLVREQEVATSISTGYNPFSRGDVLFIITASPTKVHDLATLEEAIFQEIQKIIDEPPRQKELEIALAKIKASEVYGQDSIYQQAQSLGRLAVIEQDWRLGQDWLQHISTVTPANVQAVAQKYLQKDRMTLMHLLPEDAQPDEAMKTKQDQADAGVAP